MSNELPVATRHHHDMTEKLLKATLNLKKQTEEQKAEVIQPSVNHFIVVCTLFPDFFNVNLFTKIKIQMHYVIFKM